MYVLRFVLEVCCHIISQWLYCLSIELYIIWLYFNKVGLCYFLQGKVPFSDI